MLELCPRNVHICVDDNLPVKPSVNDTYVELSCFSGNSLRSLHLLFSFFFFCFPIKLHVLNLHHMQLNTYQRESWTHNLGTKLTHVRCVSNLKNFSSFFLSIIQKYILANCRMMTIGTLIWVFGEYRSKRY